MKTNGGRMRVAVQLTDWGQGLYAWVTDHDDSLGVEMIRDRYAALEADVDVVVVELDAPWVDQALLNDLRDAGVQLVGVYRSGDDMDRLIQFGVHHRVAAHTSPDQLAYLLRRLRPAITTTAARSASPEWVTMGWPFPLVFGGPPGAGARELAIHVAGMFADRDSTVLVDANEATAGVAQRLGLDETPNIRTAVDTLRHGRVRYTVADASAVPFDVIVGMPAMTDWSRLSIDDVDALVMDCRRLWARVVVTTCPIVEDLSRWGSRYGVSRALLDGRYPIVGTVKASPMGVARFADWFAQVNPSRPVAVVVNHVPRRDPHVLVEVEEQLISLLGDGRISIVGHVPFEPWLRRAEWDGELLVRGRFRKAIQTVAAMVAPLMAPIEEIDGVPVYERS